MSRNFEVRGAGIGETEVLMKGWYSWSLFEGMECFEERPAPDYPVLYFYPDPADLRKRLAELEADPAPVVESMNHWFSRLEEPGLDPWERLPWVFRSMHRLVDRYESAFANRTEWRSIHKLSEIDVPDGALEQDDDHGPLGEPQGETVESRNPSLSEHQREIAPSRRHREPYIIWC